MSPRMLSFFFSSRRRHTRWNCDWSSDVCSSDLPAARRKGATGEGSAWWVYAIVGLFALLVAGIFLSAFLNSIASTWFGGWLPDDYTTKWYRFALAEFNLGYVLGVTIVVGLTVTLISLALGVPAAYVLARRAFPGRAALLLLLVLPMLVPPITYGIP